MKQRTALVTGNLGFLGRYFEVELIERGWWVMGVDVRSNVPPMDCRDVFNSNRRFDLVIHCAAQIGGRFTIENQPLAAARNIELDAAMFQWATRVVPGHVVYISSSAVYPVTYQELLGSAPLTEPSTDVNAAKVGVPDQVYGWSKLIGEVLADKLRASGVTCTVVRPFSGYGHDQDKTYPFRAFLERARAREDPFDVWSDGRQVRDFVHVYDVVGATLAAVDAGLAGPLNICTGVGTSFLTLARLFARAAGYDPVIRPLGGDTPRGVTYRVGDPTLLRKIYTPKISIDEGIRDALSR